MMVTQFLTDNEDGHNNVLDLSVNKKPISNNEIILKQNQNLSLLLSPPSSSSSSSVITLPKPSPKGHKRMSESSRTTTTTMKAQQTPTIPSNKRPLRFQCKHCDYKAPSTSLMQNHIYRHTDLTPYACAYCGHKSTTKSTIMVHIELCHPNQEVKINENRVREQDFYRDLNSSEMASPISTIQEPQTKKHRRSNQYDSESAPINGVAISLKAIADDDNESSPASDETSETENLEPILFDDYHVVHDDTADEQHTTSNHNNSLPTTVKPSLKLNISSQQIPILDSTSPVAKDSDSDDASEYLLVYNRPKQYYGSLYEPDKQYACKLCSYTTNHRPSMEDHVFVHTNEKPYKCGYCGEEIYTRYAATYHIKYKHAGMARNFIQNKADVTQYYVNRAKTEDEKNQFKVIDTRLVRVPTRHGKPVIHHQQQQQQQHKNELSTERSVQPVDSPSPSTTVVSTSPSPSQVPISSTSNGQTPPDYRLLLAWSYYLASQAAWLSPMFQQQGQSTPSIPTDPETAAKFLQQAMQSAMEPPRNFVSTFRNSRTDNEQIETEIESTSTDTTFAVVKEEAEES